MGAVFGLLFVIAIIVFYGWLFLTPAGQQARAQAASRRAVKRAGAGTISQVGTKTDAGLACPRCGGTQFRPARKTATKVTFGASSMLGQAKHVRCVTCGTLYRRG